MSLRLLIVEDRRSLAQMLAETFAREGYEVTLAHRGDHAVAMLRDDGPFLAVLTDLKLPGADGLAVLAVAREVDPHLPVFLITAHASVDTAVAALKQGARDYFPKPLDLDRVLAAVAAAAAPRRALLAAPGAGEGLPELIGGAPAFLAAVAALRRVATTDATVLLEGPSGSGKELFAHALHRLSGRPSGPFVAFNCAAVPDSLVESELFGHERGAFTGATARHPGRFEQANRGTLFLDEVGEVPLPTQVKLLRVLEENRISRLGGEGEVEIDVRIVAATNRDLAVAVAGGTFRRDLFHRLRVFPIRLPSLAERREDIPVLALHLVGRAAARHGVLPPVLRPATLAVLVLAPWPGNVRELANTLERSAILAETGSLGPTELGIDAVACRSGLDDAATRVLAVRLAGGELDELARFLGVDVRRLER
ncbi:MAG: sigma-54-dependent Fis family transcriptional regulator [Acidobacteria bacterium]|nr:sigma-54-dependent Fis family transcriptional regulator [Acidobacteriota bacterium]